MSEHKCHTCGEPFEAEMNGYILTNCPSCSQRYLAGERHLKETIKNEREQRKLF